MVLLVGLLEGRGCRNNNRLRVRLRVKNVPVHPADTIINYLTEFVTNVIIKETKNYYFSSDVIANTLRVVRNQF